MSAEQTVFVVDDEPAVAKALARLLRANGYSTRVFGSAREFMQQYQAGAAGCLVADLSMPEISGVDLLRWLVASRPSLPILFLTGLDEIPPKVRATMMEGAVDILTKPVDGSALIEGVEKALARNRQARGV